MRYRKRPLVIDAVQWTGSNAAEVKDFTGADGFLLPDEHAEAWDEAAVWAEAEGCWMRCPLGHWVIRGITGEFYPCDPDIFARTYEPVEATS